jgi:hypothetical protein
MPVKTKKRKRSKEEEKDNEKVIEEQTIKIKIKRKKGETPNVNFGDALFSQDSCPAEVRYFKHQHVRIIDCDAKTSNYTVVRDDESSALYIIRNLTDELVDKNAMSFQLKPYHSDHPYQYLSSLKRYKKAVDTYVNHSVKRFCSVPDPSNVCKFNPLPTSPLHDSELNQTEDDKQVHSPSTPTSIKRKSKQAPSRSKKSSKSSNRRKTRSSK